MNINKMKVLVCLLIGMLMSCQTPTIKFKLHQLNIWHEGTIVKGGYEAIVDEIVQVNADVVALSEVRNYKGVNYMKRLVISLKEKGLNYTYAQTYDTGILSKYPIVEAPTKTELYKNSGSVTKVVIQFENSQQAAIYSAHLDYLNCAYYAIRQYDPNTWEMLEEPVIDTAEIRRINQDSDRDDAARSFVVDAKKELKKERLVFLLGDFNEPSHLDWIEANKHLYDHHGLTFDWDVSKILYKHGFLDSYRVMYPNPVSYPGFTYPSANKDMPIEKLTWAPKTDERERIDFIYYFPNSKLNLKDSYVHGPRGTVVRSKEEELQNLEKHLEPKDIWPSDHKGVVSIFEIQL
jgi:endonuclease/exonuclease/phosphatase family metal-dependent hydrolase